MREPEAELSQDSNNSVDDSKSDISDSKSVSKDSESVCEDSKTDPVLLENNDSAKDENDVTDKKHYKKVNFLRGCFFLQIYTAPFFNAFII